MWRTSRIIHSSRRPIGRWIWGVKRRLMSRASSMRPTHQTSIPSIRSNFVIAIVRVKKTRSVNSSIASPSIMAFSSSHFDDFSTMKPIAKYRWTTMIAVKREQFTCDNLKNVIDLAVSLLFVSVHLYPPISSHIPPCVIKEECNKVSIFISYSFTAIKMWELQNKKHITNRKSSTTLLFASITILVLLLFPSHSSTCDRSCNFILHASQESWNWRNTVEGFLFYVLQSNLVSFTFCSCATSLTSLVEVCLLIW